MFRSRTRRVRGHAAIFAWSDLILDRSCKLVGPQSPAACATRAGGDSGPNFESYVRPPPRPVPGHRARCSRPFMAGEPGCRRQALVSWVLFEVALPPSVRAYAPSRFSKPHPRAPPPDPGPVVVASDFWGCYNA